MSLNKQMVLSNTMLETNDVGQIQWLRPARVQKSKHAVAQLTLTSLVDCFTILVIYLLVVTHIGARDINTDRGIKLPMAAHSMIPSESAVIRMKGGRYFINDERIQQNHLVRELESLAEKTSIKTLLIQADKEVDFESLNPIILSGLQAGYEKIGFAVLAEATK